MQEKREKHDRKKPQKKTVNVKMMLRWTTKKNRKRKKKTRTESNKKTKTKKTVPMERCWDEPKKERTGRKRKSPEQKQTKKDCGNEKMLRRATEKEQEEKEKDQTKIKQTGETLVIY